MTGDVSSLYRLREREMEDDAALGLSGPPNARSIIFVRHANNAVDRGPIAV